MRTFFSEGHPVGYFEVGPIQIEIGFEHRAVLNIGSADRFGARQINGPCAALCCIEQICNKRGLVKTAGTVPDDRSVFRDNVQKWNKFYIGCQRTRN